MVSGNAGNAAATRKRSRPAFKLKPHFQFSQCAHDLIFILCFFKKIDKPAALEIASELHLLVAAIFESAKLEARPYDEVALVAYGEGVLVFRKLEEFSAGFMQDHTQPDMAMLANDSWNEIRQISRTVFIARGEAPNKSFFLSHVPSGTHHFWERVSGWLAGLITH